MIKPLLCLAVVLASTAAIHPSGPRRKVVVDVDAGVDDAMALLLLLSKHSQIEVVAVTCVSGNTGLSNVTRNVLRTLAMANRLDIPVYRGTDQGLVYPEATDSFWGDDGFGDCIDSLPIDTSIIREEHSAIALAKLVKQNPNSLTILALGPLTNIALAGHLNDKFFDQIEHLVILGGSYQGSGNVKAGVEFNIYADPEAATFVFSKATPHHSIIVVPLETIEKAGVPMDYRLKTLGRVNSPLVSFLNCIEAKAIKKMGDVWTYFDQAAAGIVILPNAVEEYIKRKVTIETQGKQTRGAMVVDHRSKTGPVTLVTSVNSGMLTSMFLRCLRKDGHNL